MSNILTSIGLVLDIIGAVTVGWFVITKRSKAIELSTSRWDVNLPQMQDRLAQSTAAKWGLAALVLGFSLQLAGVWVSDRSVTAIPPMRHEPPTEEMFSRVGSWIVRAAQDFSLAQLLRYPGVETQQFG